MASATAPQPNRTFSSESGGKMNGNLLACTVASIVQGKREGSRMYSLVASNIEERQMNR